MNLPVRLFVKNSETQNSSVIARNPPICVDRDEKLKPLFFNVSKLVCYLAGGVPMVVSQKALSNRRIQLTNRIVFLALRLRLWADDYYRVELPQPTKRNRDTDWSLE